MFKKKIFVSLLLVLFVCAGLLDFNSARSENEDEVQKAVAYLQSQSQDAWMTMALAAAGEPEIGLGHLKAVAADQQSITSYAKYILALAAVGENPTSFGNEDYLARLKSFYNAGTKQFGEGDFVNDDIWALLALGALGQENLTIAQAAKDFILANQNEDGGWGYSSAASSDSNDTAAALMALLEVGLSADHPAITKAVNYLKTTQNSDGGFCYNPHVDWSKGSDSASSAWVISAIYKLGQDPTDAAWTKEGNNAISFLISLQDKDGGFWWQVAGDNKSDTAWAVIALAGKTFPVWSSYNKHLLRIEGEKETVWQGFIYGATPLELIVNAARQAGYEYQIVEYPFGLYLKKLAGQADGWMYLVNYLEPALGAADYYLKTDDEVLFYFGQWLENGWLPTKVELSQTETVVKIYVKYFDDSTKDWRNLGLEGLKLKIGDAEITTNSAGQAELALATLSDGFYQVFSESQVIQDRGYIRSEKVNLKAGEAPQGHKVGLFLEIERITAPGSGEQTAIDFSVSPDILDFGSLKPGESNTQTLQLANGSSPVHLETEVAGAAVFQDNLQVNEHPWPLFSIDLAAGQSKTFPLKVEVPLNYQGNFGQQQGELIFWAIKE